MLWPRNNFSFGKPATTSPIFFIYVQAIFDFLAELINLNLPVSLVHLSEGYYNL